MQQLLYLGLSATKFKMVQGLDCVQLFVDQFPVLWHGKNVSHKVDSVTAEKFRDLSFVCQETASTALENC